MCLSILEKLTFKVKKKKFDQFFSKATKINQSEINCNLGVHGTFICSCISYYL